MRRYFTIIAVLCVLMCLAGCSSSGSYDAGYEAGREDGYEEGYEAGMEEAGYEFEDETGDALEELDFYQRAAVLVPVNGDGRYHQYGCGHLYNADGSMKEYYLFNIEYAEHKGYPPCIDCYN